MNFTSGRKQVALGIQCFFLNIGSSGRVIANVGVIIPLKILSKFICYIYTQLRLLLVTLVSTEWIRSPEQSKSSGRIAAF
jgi:hypothetical protein